MSYDIKTSLYNNNLKSLLNDFISQINGQNNTMLLGNPTLAIGSSSKKKIKNSAFDVIRDGVVSTIAGTETVFTATSDDIADGKEAIFLVYLDEDNVITLLKGDDADSGEAVCPDTPEGGLKMGEVKIAVSGAIFNATTDDLDSAHITDTYTNKTDVPSMDDYEAKNWLHWANLKTILSAINDVVVYDGGAKLLSNPTLVIGTSSKAKIKHSDFDVMIDGAVTTIAGGEVAFTATTHDVADGDGAVFLVYLDGSTVKISKGTSTTGGTGAVCPTTPAGKLKLGEVKIVSSGALFDATTTELDAVTVTDTYTNVTDDMDNDFSLSYTQKHYLFSKNLLDIFEDIIAELEVKNHAKVISNPTLVIGTSSKAKIKHSTFQILVDGVLSSITGAEVAFTATSHDVADGYEAVFNVAVKLADNTIVITKGTSVAIGAGAVCPATPASHLKVGEVKIASSGALFDATTTELDAVTVTDTYTNKIDILESIE